MTTLCVCVCKIYLDISHFHISQWHFKAQIFMHSLLKCQRVFFPYLLLGLPKLHNTNLYGTFKLPCLDHFSAGNFSPFDFYQFSSVAQSYPTLCDPMNRSTPGLPVHHKLPKFTQTHVHRVGDAIQPSHPLSSPSPPAPNPCQHQGLLQQVNSLNEVAKVLEFQLQHQSFQ